MTSILNFIKIYQFVQTLLGGTHRRTDRQNGDLINLTFLFKESRLIKEDRRQERGKKRRKNGRNKIRKKKWNKPENSPNATIQT
jgi:hypothetical protein